MLAVVFFIIFCVKREKSSVILAKLLDATCCVVRRPNVPPLPMDDSGDSEAELEDLPVPSYWHHQDAADHFDERFEVSSRVLKDIQRVMNRTWKAIATRDRKGKAPRGIRLIAGQRIEDSKLWANYAKQRETIKSLRGVCISPHMLDGKPDTGFVKTLIADESSSEMWQDHLDADAKEYYLFHGTPPEAATHISENGFRIDLSGSNAGTMFGRGAYFAENSSKSDEYASEGNGIYRHTYAMLLCRVCCGSFHYMTRSDQASVDRALNSGRCDSVLGDRESSVGTYREFVVFKSAQIYPEYVLLYKRVTEEDSEDSGSESG